MCCRASILITGLWLVVVGSLDSSPVSGATPTDVNELSATQGRVTPDDLINDRPEIPKEINPAGKAPGNKIPRLNQNAFDNNRDRPPIDTRTPPTRPNYTGDRMVLNEIPPRSEIPPELLTAGDHMSEELRKKKLNEWIEKERRLEFERGRKKGWEEALTMENKRKVRSEQSQIEQRMRRRDGSRSAPDDLSEGPDELRSAPRTMPQIENWRRQRKDSGNRHPRFGGPPMLHTFDVQTAEGIQTKLSRENFPDAKTFLIVNTASGCQFTPQYEGLEKLFRNFKKAGLRIIAFPSNSFNLEPLENVQIQEFVKEKYDVTFPVMAKVDVNGPEAPEIFNWLKKAEVYTKVPGWSTLKKTGLNIRDVQWNFEKFLVIRQHNLESIYRFSYDVAPAELVKYVVKAINLADIRDKKVEL